MWVAIVEALRGNPGAREIPNSHGEGVKGFLVVPPEAQPGPGQNWEAVDTGVSSLPLCLARLSLGHRFCASAIRSSPVIRVFQSELITFIILGCEWPVQAIFVSFRKTERAQKEESAGPVGREGEERERGVVLKQQSFPGHLRSHPSQGPSGLLISGPGWPGPSLLLLVPRHLGEQGSETVSGSRSLGGRLQKRHRPGGWWWQGCR